MKKGINDSTELPEVNIKSSLGAFLKKQAQKIKEHQFTCPFCREALHGISAFGRHLKKHCT
ncbi:MAG: hypothetical protein C4526_08015 [Nitrospiraceae bacterium]|nr:MAG: hypothetical protein C4526_08015 [Nitrospiraceae bacterium]